jgi:hypothetical protein
MTAIRERLRTVTDHEPSWWLRTQLDNLLAGWQANGIRPCPHLRRDPGGAPGITALYRPDVLTCPGRCSEVFKLTGAADFTCDRCHEVTDTIGGIVYDILLGGRRILIMLGLCRTCETREFGR